MLCLIDCGNTNTLIALCDKDHIVHRWRLRTSDSRTEDEYVSFLWPLFQSKKISFDIISDVLISSVVPEANDHLKRLSDKYFGHLPRFVRRNDLYPQIKILLDKPEEIGADRLVNAAAIHAYYAVPAIVIDFGTATTFDVINGNGSYVGGVIAPGINLSMTALHHAAAKLPKVSIQKPSNAIGKNTVTAMQSGLYWGYVGLITGLLDKLAGEMSEPPRTVLGTGGLASMFSNDVPGLTSIDEDLTLKGLLEIYKGHE